MRTPLVYDGRNIYNPRDMKAAGVEYHSIEDRHIKNEERVNLPYAV